VVQQLIKEALEAAWASNIEVRAPALLHISRVLTASNVSEATRVFEQAIALMAHLPMPTAQYLNERVLLIGAAVRPGHVRALQKVFPVPRRQNIRRLLRIMVDHGHALDAFEYLVDAANSDEYPYAIVPFVSGAYRNDHQRMQAARAAAVVWTRTRRDEFLRIFALNWVVLHQQEAKQILHDLLASVLGTPDRKIDVNIATETDNIEFASERDLRLFELLPVLQALEPEIAISIVQSRPQLAKAVARFPRGIRLHSAQSVSGDTLSGSIRAGSTTRPPGDRPDVDEIELLFSDAWRHYWDDSSDARPNLAPRECWPSTQLLRQAFHLAAQRCPNDAPELLGRVIDRDLHLFSQIALAASLAGLPELRLSQS
jgi:hypothetical protein